MQWHEFRTHIRHLPAKDLGRLERAFALGKKMHGDQKRFSGDPYFNHPIAVAMMLSDLGADADTLIASLLHDTVEDTPISIAEIDHQFDGSVGKLIDGLTKLSSEDVAMSPNLNEQVETLRKIFTLMQSDIRIMVIKLIDRLHNMQTIEFLPPERQRLLAEETAEVFVKIADRLCMRDIRDELGALCLSVLEPELYEKLKDIRLSNEQRSTPIVEKIHQNFRFFDPVLSAHTKVFFANKSWGQLRTQYEAPAAIGTSFVTAIFICNDVDNCYRTLGILHQMWKREMLSFEDFVNVPQLNGYRGIHTTIIAPDGTRVRCKIRTREMQEYSRLGVSSVCFKGPTNIGEILPWTKLISPLAVDTEGSSNDFWQNLKSDILGEAITVHGPDDTTVQLPKNATALDGVFHLFQENALRTKAVRVNGQEVPLNTVLAKGVSLDLELADKETCTLDWLHSVNTGFAAAEIRRALASYPNQKKILIGQQILQRVLSHDKKGQLEEFNVKSLSALLHSHGFGSPDETYIAIAEGRQNAEDVYDSLFKAQSTHKEQPQKSRYQTKFSLSKVEVPALLKLLMSIGPIFEIDWSSIRVNLKENLVRVSGAIKAMNPDIKLLEKDLRSSGATDIEIYEPIRREYVLTGILIFLWGLNPVIAKWLLSQGITPLTLVSLRMLVFGFCASVLFLAWRMTTGKRFTPIPNLLRLSLLPSIATIALAVFTYEALLSMPPSLHLVILRFTVLLLPVFHFLYRVRAWIVGMIVAALALFGVLLLAMTTPPSGWIWGLFFSVLALCTYVLYSAVVEQTLYEHKIGFRYPALLFSSGLLLGLFGIILIPFTALGHLPAGVITLIGLYTFFCVFIPHACYYLLLNKRQMKKVSDLFFLETPIAVFGEMLLLGLFLPLWLYLLIAALLVGIYFAHGQTQIKSIA